MPRMRPRSFYQRPQVLEETRQWAPPILTMGSTEEERPIEEKRNLSLIEELHLYATLETHWIENFVGEARVKVMSAENLKTLAPKNLFEAPVMTGMQLIWVGKGYVKYKEHDTLLPLSTPFATKLGLSPTQVLGKQTFECFPYGLPVDLRLYRPDRDTYYWAYKEERYPDNTLLLFPAGACYKSRNEALSIEPQYMQIATKNDDTVVNLFGASQLRQLNIIEGENGMSNIGAYEFVLSEHTLAPKSLNGWVENGGLQLDAGERDRFYSVALLSGKEEASPTKIIYRKAI